MKEERRRIARDLHDVVLQELVGVLQSLRLTHLRNKNSKVGLDLEEELEALGRATLGLRSAVHDLREENERPFVKSVGSLVELNRRLTPKREIGLVVEEGFPNGLLGEVGVELLRVIREALTNARYHSGAKRVVVTLKVVDSALVAEVSDDGQGFELETVSGVGLSSRRERAAIVDGRLEIGSRVKRGTSVRLRVPVPQTGKDAGAELAMLGRSRTAEPLVPTRVARERESATAPEGYPQDRPSPPGRTPGLPRP